MDKRRSKKLPVWPACLGYGLLTILSLVIYFQADPLTPAFALVAVLGLALASAILVSPFLLNYIAQSRERLARLSSLAEEQFDVLRHAIDELHEMRLHTVRQLNTMSELQKRFESLESRYRDRLEELATIDTGGNDESSNSEWRDNLDLTLEKLKGQLEGLREDIGLLQTRETEPADNQEVLTRLARLDEAIGLMSDRMDELSEELLKPIAYEGEEEEEETESLNPFPDDEEPEKEASPLQAEEENEIAPAPATRTVRKKTDNGQVGLWNDFADPSAKTESDESVSALKKATRHPLPNDEVALIAKVNIGLGNTPYIRGEGPGLSWDKGVPMKFVEIGKWEWRASQADVPVICRIFKNDREAAIGEFIEVGLGEEVETHPTFKA